MKNLDTYLITLALETLREQVQDSDNTGARVTRINNQIQVVKNIQADRWKKA
tara:strand:- start:329 stop:484 length:156 start_codon:yes stop_codon:yes gene_type:complete